eukprot:scaffold9483_cov59-Phaeocystis_antarctica.AAC.1
MWPRRREAWSSCTHAHVERQGAGRYEQSSPPLGSGCLSRPARQHWQLGSPATRSIHVGGRAAPWLDGRRLSAGTLL